MRLLDLFGRWGIKTSWFVPGHSMETFPEQMKRVAAAGHEFGVHGYSHENPIALTSDQEETILVKCIGLIEQLTGRKPRGYAAPWWELSPATAGLLLQHGFRYDHSMFHNDFTPYYVRVGDRWNKIDYSKHPDTWMKPLQRGTETDLIEIPASWYLDDLPPMMFIKKAPNSHGFVNPLHLEEIWRDQFDWVYREMDYAVFPITIHPDVAGKPQVLLMPGASVSAHERATGRALHAARGHRGGFRATDAPQEVADVRFVRHFRRRSAMDGRGRDSRPGDVPPRTAAPRRTSSAACSRPCASASTIGRVRAFWCEAGPAPWRSSTTCSISGARRRPCPATGSIRLPTAQPEMRRDREAAPARAHGIPGQREDHPAQPIVT
jgi:peptidoglycan/xylan/chitin deacetylase (PgdA/CDA1 family)